MKKVYCSPKILTVDVETDEILDGIWTSKDDGSDVEEEETDDWTSRRRRDPIFGTDSTWN